MSAMNRICRQRMIRRMTPEDLAEKTGVTVRTVSAWESGETVPDEGTLKLLSRVLDVPVNALLDAPRQLVCQCCGMPMDDLVVSREPDGTFNEEYCQWCYAGGKFTYASKEELIDFCAEHLATEECPAEQIRAHMEAIVPALRHWNG